MKAKEFESLESRHKKTVKEHKMAENTVLEKAGEITRLSGILKEAVDQHMNTKKDYASTMAERDILGT